MVYSFGTFGIADIAVPLLNGADLLPYSVQAAQSTGG